MHISILLMEQIIELFIMILMGFIIVKAGIVKDEDSKVLSKIVLYLIIPCVIINAFQVDYTSKTVRGLLIAFVASVILQLVLLFIISAMGRLFHMNEVEVASVYYSNSGNLIVPIVTFILGQEWVLYGCCRSGRSAGGLRQRPHCRRRTENGLGCKQYLQHHFQRRHRGPRDAGRVGLPPQRKRPLSALHGVPERAG